MADQCEPLFVTARSLPYFDSPPDTIDMCAAAEAVTGRGTMRGAQRIKGLWRLCPRQSQFRDKLLMEGMVMKGIRIQLVDKNPFLIEGSEEERPATKVIIGNIPLSCDNNEIEIALKKLGVETRSKIRNELARNKEGALTQWETGRRFVFITTPTTPLPPTLRVGIFTGEVYHKEQKKTVAKCRNCLTVGHLAATCTNQVVCITCGSPGHKRGDELCPLSDRPAQQTTPTPSPSVPSPPPDQAPEMDSASHSAPTLTPQAATARKTIQPSISFQRAKSASSKRQRTRSPPTADSERSPNSKRLSRAEAFFESMRAKSTNKHNADTGHERHGTRD